MPGGTHADNLTTNTLILLADGCYIELISFIPQTTIPEISKHWWGPDIHREGWADWCLTTSTTAEENFARLEKGEEKSHARPRAGARRRPAGVEVKWAVTFPTGENGGQENRARIPFFCHDDPVTARLLRVPIDEMNTKHSSGVLGVRSFTVLVRDRDLLRATGLAYAGVFGHAGVRNESGDEIVFEAGRAIEIKALEGKGAKVTLKVAKGEEEGERVTDRGFWLGDVVLCGIGELGTIRLFSTG